MFHGLMNNPVFCSSVSNVVIIVHNVLEAMRNITFVV